jgi:hypothetical protein
MWSFLKRLGSPFRKAHASLYPWDIAYFEHLIAELNGLGLPPTDPALLRAQRLIENFRNPDPEDTENDEHVTRSSLLELEQTLLSLQSTETLLQRAPILRLRYREVVGESQFGVYVPADISKCLPGSESIRAQLLPDLKNLVSGIHWRYILLPLLDKVQTGLTKNIIWCVLFYTVGWLISLSITGSWVQMPFLSMLATVIYAGIIGGYVSSLRRVQSVRPDTDSLLTIQALQNSRYFLWLSPLLGAIFAVALLLVFLSKLVGGMAFPGFNTLDCKDCTFSTQVQSWPFWNSLCPSSSAEYAKLFLWSFIAGFAERFVPDLLDRIVQRGQNASTQGPGGGSSPTLPRKPVAGLSDQIQDATAETAESASSKENSTAKLKPGPRNTQNRSEKAGTTSNKKSPNQTASKPQRTETESAAPPPAEDPKEEK